MATLSLTSSFFLSHLILTVDPIERLFQRQRQRRYRDRDKDVDQYRCNHNDKDKYRGHDIWFGFMATHSLTSSFFLSHLIPTVDPIERLFKHGDKEKTQKETKTKTKTNTDAIIMTKANTEAMTYGSVLWHLTSSLFLSHLIIRLDPI